MIVILLFSSISISFSSGGREIIKAYEKGKPAKLDIEVTKVRSDNYVDLFIDKSEKKIYRDISKQTRESSDLSQKLYVTTYLKPNSKSNTINDELPHRVINLDGKKYLEITYFQEPKNIYLWTVQNGKVQKLYTGVLKEFVNPQNPITHINYTLTEKHSDKIHKIGNDYLIFKIGNIQLKDISDRDIRLTLHEGYSFKNKDLKNIPVKLYFKNNERAITLTKDSPTADIFCYFKVQNETDALGTFYLNDLEKDSKEFSLAVDFRDSGIKIAKTSDNLLTFNDYEIMPLGWFNGNVIIDTYSSSNTTLNVNFKKSSWYSYPTDSQPAGIYSVSGSLSNGWSWFNNVAFFSKTAKIEFSNGDSAITVSSTLLSELNSDGNFKMTFKKNGDLLETEFTRSNANIKKVTVTMKGTILFNITEDVIEIIYNEGEPLFGYEVTHMDFGTISSKSNKSEFNAEAEVTITPNKNLTCQYSFPSNVDIVTGDGSGSSTEIPAKQKIAVSLQKSESGGSTTKGSVDVTEGANTTIKIKGTIQKSNLTSKDLGEYRGNFSFTITASERTKGGKF